jgi:hypothetical protein
MTRPVTLDTSAQTLSFNPVEAAPATVAAPAPVVEKEAPAQGMMAVAFDLYKLAAVLGLSISKNERSSTEETKKMYKHWSKVGVDSTKGQGTTGFFVAAMAFTIPLAGELGHVMKNTPSNDRKANNQFFQKISDLTPQFLSPWTQGQAAAGQEAQGKSSLLQTDLQNGPQAASQFRNNVEEASKNMAQNIFRLVADAAKNGG